jgi:hypothetical protein
MPVKSKPNPDDILQAEYEYIVSTIFQANEDRSRVTSFYLVTVGSLVAAILSAIFSVKDLKNVSLAFSGLFLMLTFLGALTLAQLARLRSAWHESAQAMNQIKDYYIRLNPQIESAFKWRSSTLPKTDKRYSIANLMALEVAFLGAITAASAVYFLLFFLAELTTWGWALIAATFAILFVSLWRWYKYLLVDNQ